MDGAFFRDDVLSLLRTNKASYAVKVPFWRHLNLQKKIKNCDQWQRIEEGGDGFSDSLTIKAWDQEIQVFIYRKRVLHKTRKNYQLDLFDPDDGTWEYSAIASDLPWDIRSVWRFMCGRGMHEKVIGQLKTGLALDTIPTNHYGANSAWQQLVVLTHNLLTNFQIETGAQERNRSQKRTTRWTLRSAQTLRFEIFNRAARLIRPGGTATLALLKNQKTEKRLRRIEEKLRKAA